MLSFIKCIISNAKFLYRRYIIISQRASPDDQVVKEPCSSGEDSNKVQTIFIGTLAHF